MMNNILDGFILNTKTDEYTILVDMDDFKNRAVVNLLSEKIFKYYSVA